MSKYEALDERILWCIDCGKASTDEIVGACCAEAYLADIDHAARGTIVRRIEELRDAGFIEHVGAWRIVKECA